MLTLQIGSSTFTWGSQTYIMGIVNVTPDSFSGDGLIRGKQWIEAAVEQGQRFAQEGAHVIDVGGESTRPGSDPVPEKLELERVVPVIQELSQTVDVPISIDTYKARVAEAALEAGAHMVNDVWGLRLDPAMAGLCATRQVPVVITHNRRQPRNTFEESQLSGRYPGPTYEDVVAEVTSDLEENIKLAREAGIRDEQIIVDPGIGFGKTPDQNLILLNHLDTLKKLGFPLLLGTSNKSFIGYALDVPADDRLEGTAATIAIGIDRGADIVRVHQVKAMSRVAKMTDTIVRPSVTRSVSGPSS